MAIIFLAALLNRAYLVTLTCLVLTVQLTMHRLYFSSTVNNLSQQYHTPQQQRRIVTTTRDTKYDGTNSNTTKSLPFVLSSSSTPSSSLLRNTTLPLTSSPRTMIASTSAKQREHFCSSQVLGEKQTWNHHKKVISYSIFGPPSSSSKLSIINNNNNNNSDNDTTNSSSSSSSNSSDIPEWVILGMEQNIKDAQLYYPDWIVRIYMFDVPQALQNKWLYHHPTRYYNVELVECYSATLMTTSPSRKMISRFLAYDDPKVWYTLVRDADSRLLLREVMAVHEFLQASLVTSTTTTKEKDDLTESTIQRMTTENINSTTTTTTSQQPHTSADESSPPPIYFHAMRDHPHHIVAVMGGMFGMKAGLLQQSNHFENVATMSQVVYQAFSAKPHFLGGGCGKDQFLLQVHLWPYVRHVTLTHDMNLNRCHGFGAKVCRDFPLGPRDDRIDYFVGSAFKQKYNRTTEWEVRPQHHVCTLQCHLANDTATQ